MITFKTFLTEKWKKYVNTDMGDGERWVLLKHHGKVNGHDVRVDIDRTKKYGSHHAQVDFAVNNTHHEGGVDHGHHILDHVHKVVSNYIKKTKPTSLYFGGNTDQKKQLYHRYANHLAKKHGGHVEVFKNGSVRVHLNHKQPVQESVIDKWKASLESIESIDPKEREEKIKNGTWKVIPIWL